MITLCKILLNLPSIAQTMLCKKIRLKNLPVILLKNLPMHLYSMDHILLQPITSSTHSDTGLARSYCSILSPSIYSVQCTSASPEEIKQKFIILCYLKDYISLFKDFATCVVATRITFSKMVYEAGAWQVPCWKLPQVPKGVPKLANLIEEIDCPEPQRRWTLGLWNSSVLP